METKVENLKSQLHKLETAKPVDELTVEDVYEMNPKLRDQVHQMIRDDHWAVGGDEKKEMQTVGAGVDENFKEKEKLNYL